MQPFNSEFDTAKQITGVKNSISLGAKGIIFSPFDSSAAGTVLKTAAAAKVPVVAVDVAPDTGPVAIVVRANNIAYGEKACHYIGDHVAEGPVVQIMGDQASINGRDRGTGFRDCIKKNYPKLKLLEIPTKAWSGEDAAAGLDTILNSTPDLKAIYMHAGGVFLAPTLQTLKRRGLLHPAGQAGHIIIVSNDGIPQEFDAIRKGEADATVSQPADLYAKYGIMYLKEAIEGKTFKAGPTDHDSTIVEVAPGVLEDQLSAPRWSPRRTSTTSRSGATTSKNADAKRPHVRSFDARRARRSSPARRFCRSSRRSAFRSAMARPRAERRAHPRHAGRVARAGRPQRRRQVDAGRDSDRAARARRRRGPLFRRAGPADLRPGGAGAGRSPASISIRPSFPT